MLMLPTSPPPMFPPVAVLALLHTSTSSGGYLSDKAEIGCVLLILLEIRCCRLIIDGAIRIFLFSRYCRTPDWQSSPVQLLIGKSGRLYIRVVGRSGVRHGRDSSDVTLALEDAQVVRRSVGRY